jgi:hypothetical protein
MIAKAVPGVPGTATHPGELATPASSSERLDKHHPYNADYLLPAQQVKVGWRACSIPSSGAVQRLTGSLCEAMTVKASVPAPADGVAGTEPGHYRFGAVLDSERIKIVSVRSTVWTQLATVVVGIGLSAVVTSAQAARYSARTIAAQQAFDPTRSSLSGILFAQLAIGVLAVLVVTAEYSTGTIRATFSAVPQRPLVLAAKVVLFSVITFIVGEAV